MASSCQTNPIQILRQDVAGVALKTNEVVRHLTPHKSWSGAGVNVESELLCKMSPVNLKETITISYQNM